MMNIIFPDTMRAYIQQLRQECGARVCEKVFDPATDKPSKVCMTVAETSRKPVTW